MVQLVKRSLSLITTGVLLLLPAGSVQAFHATDDVIVGKNYTGTPMPRFHPGFKHMDVGQTATFSFEAGIHNAGINAASLPAGAAPFRSPNFNEDSLGGGSPEPVPSTWTYTFTVPGTYNYYCGIHATQADSDAATYDANGEPSNNKHVGRIIVEEHPEADIAMNVIVGGVRSAADGRTVVTKVSNVGSTTETFTVPAPTATVNGVPAASPAFLLSATSTVTLGPGSAKRIRWRQPWAPGEVTPGATVAFTGCISVPMDSNAANDCDEEVRTAK